MTVDPISDMLTTIRNGLKARLFSVATPASNLKAEIARVMKEAGYIADAVTTSEFPKKLVITLKYSDRAVPAITEIKRISKPGLRKYVSVAEIPSVQCVHRMEPVNIQNNGVHRPVRMFPAHISGILQEIIPVIKPRQVVRFRR